MSGGFKKFLGALLEGILELALAVGCYFIGALIFGWLGISFEGMDDILVLIGSLVFVALLIGIIALVHFIKRLFHK